MILIKLYEEWMKTGKIFNDKKSTGNGGLCNAIPKKYLKTLLLIEPQGKSYTTFWGYEGYRTGSHVSDRTQFEFTTRRQTVVLLICAIHNEI